MTEVQVIASQTAPTDRSQLYTRRRFLRRWAGAALALGAGGLSLAACTPSAPPPAAPAPTKAAAAPAAAPTSPPAASAPTAAKPAAAATQAPAATRQVTVRFWTFLDPKANDPRGKAQAQIFENFRKKYPNIELAVEVMPWQEIDTKLIQAVQVGKPPDVSRASAGQMPLHASAKSIQSLDEFVGSWSAKDKADFILPWNASVFDGKKMSFSVDSRCQLLFYRKDLFEQAKIEVPKTWDDFAKVGQTLTKDPVWGTTIPLSKKGNASGLLQWFIPYLWGAGGDLLKNGKAAFNSKAGVAGYQLMYDLITKYKAMPPGAVADDIESITQTMMAGNMAMAIIGSHRVSFVRTGKATKDTLGIAHIPSPDPAKPSPTLEGGWQLIIPRGAKEKEGGWKLIEHQIDPESQMLNVKMAGEMPVRKSLLDDPWFKSPEGADFAFAMKYLSLFDNFLAYPQKYGFLTDVLAGAAQAVAQNQKPIQQALDEAAAAFDAEEGKSR